MNEPRKLTRRDYNWYPDVDDDNDYVWRHGAWEVDNRDEEVDEDALEEWEEKRRERIARQNEY
jgi:hypothetical protein